MLIAPVVMLMCATTSTPPLGTPPGGILLRDASAAEQDDVTIMFYQQQIRCRTASGREQLVLSSCSINDPNLMDEQKEQFRSSRFSCK
jgi:hypothetical protein